jgi:hypothetical protein
MYIGEVLPGEQKKEVIQLTSFFVFRHFINPCNEKNFDG